MSVSPDDVVLQVRHIGRWRLFCASYRGLQHVEQNSPRQDAFAFASQDQDSVINLAVADGLGSANLSHVGAQFVCENGVRTLSRSQPRDKFDFSEIYGEVQRDFLNFAKSRRIATRELATTLQLLRIDREGFWYGRLGDGGCVILDGKGASWLGGLDRSSLGVSNLSDLKALHRLEFESAAADSVTGFLMFTDGVEDIFLEEGKRRPHDENVRRMINLVKDKNLEELVRVFNAFLSSDFGKDLRDDKTIIAGALDTRVTPQAPLQPDPAAQPALSPSRSVRQAPSSAFGLDDRLTKKNLILVTVVLVLFLMLSLGLAEWLWGNKCLVSSHCPEPTAASPVSPETPTTPPTIDGQPEGKQPAVQQPASQQPASQQPAGRPGAPAKVRPAPVAPGTPAPAVQPSPAPNGSQTAPAKPAPPVVQPAPTPQLPSRGVTPNPPGAGQPQPQSPASPPANPGGPPPGQD